MLSFGVIVEKNNSPKFSLKKGKKIISELGHEGIESVYTQCALLNGRDSGLTGWKGWGYLKPL